ncbi:cation-translocating P-type ATPase [Pedobacter psychroterrae]|uniref:Cation-transporting P-type ATPase n=1 Tax=Pedobacter psychroterrae TaxID=2530453 RepID=A0A4R0NNG7_9SPHI|nr:cation-transporting P-type ATPase [Pedobacter psychroterrae]TCD01498.1 cation-transporting P-type ATPase [Pedobacter psychroterrae]
MGNEITYPLEFSYALNVAEVCKVLDTDQTSGITNAAAEERALKFGLNIYQSQKKKSIWMMLIGQFKSPIVYLLFAAASASLYFGNPIEAISILVVILLNALIGFFMELQARTSMRALKKMDQIFSKVIRHGKLKELPSEQIVPGDLMVLEAGDMIAADGRIVQFNQLQCDESALTGESFPVMKQLEAISGEAVLADRINMVFKGTAVMNGNAKVMVTATAENTELGKITSLVDHAQVTTTPLDLKINQLTKKLIWITLIMTGLFSLSAVLEGKSWLVILETSIALAVAAFPEGLPIVATVALAYGMLLMARKNVIVKKLSAVETLGGVNVILTDKTGTLTENKIYVELLGFPDEILRVSIEQGVLKYLSGSSQSSEENLQKLILVGTLCNDASLEDKNSGKKAIGDPVEVALLHLTEATGTSSAQLIAAYPRIAETAFSAETKMMATLNQHKNLNFVAAKGAVESILEKCTQIQSGKETLPLSADQKAAIILAAEKISADGLRVLAFGFREAPGISKEHYLEKLVYAGMVGFLDPARPAVKDAISTCRSAGIKTVMITGDHPMTALNIALKTGIATQQDQEVIKGGELPDMGSLSQTWRKRILSAVVFARTTPKQKLEIVEVYQKAGYLVAMTGDGVNDAPALKQADIGIAMGLRGTQVAKEAASIVLKDDSFISIARAVAHGREIFQNIQRFVIYLVSCNLSEIFIVTLLSFLAPQTILLPLQILFLNMVTDVFPALALGLGKGDPTVMQKPPRDPKLAIISNKNWLIIVLYAMLITASVVLAVFYCSSFVSRDPDILNNVAFITLAFAQLFHVFNMSSNHAGIWSNEVTKNRFVWLALLICILLIFLVYLFPQTRLALDLSVFSIDAWMVAISASLLPLILVQLYKIIWGKANGNSLPGKTGLI